MLFQASCVAIAGRAVLITGAPGSGKSSLALALIDRGATLVGDDGVTLSADTGLLLASPAPRIAGLIEVRNVGLLNRQTLANVPVALLLELSDQAPRLPERAAAVKLAGFEIPRLQLWPDSPQLALRAEAGLERWGLPFSAATPQIGDGI